MRRSSVFWCALCIMQAGTHPASFGNGCIIVVLEYTIHQGSTSARTHLILCLSFPINMKYQQHLFFFLLSLCVQTRGTVWKDRWSRIVLFSSHRRCPIPDQNELGSLRSKEQVLPQSNRDLPEHVFILLLKFRRSLERKVQWQLAILHLAGTITIFSSLWNLLFHTTSVAKEKWTWHKHDMTCLFWQAAEEYVLDFENGFKLARLHSFGVTTLDSILSSLAIYSLCRNRSWNR